MAKLMMQAKNDGLDELLADLRRGPNGIELTFAQRGLLKVAYDKGFIVGAEYSRDVFVPAISTRRWWQFWRPIHLEGQP